MRIIGLFGFRVLLFLSAGLALEACHSDAPSAALKESATMPAAGSDAAGAALNPELKKSIEAGISQLKGFQETLGQFKKDVLALRTEVDNLPASYKKNAKGFSDLTAQLETYTANSAVTAAQISKLTQKLNRRVNPDAAGDQAAGELATSQESALGGDWEQSIKVFDTTVKDYQEGLGKIKAIVDKLKNAKGEAVTLFE